MSFLINLTYPNHVKNYCAKEIDDRIYVCGGNYESRAAVLSYFDGSGNAIWTKEFYFESEFPAFFTNIIPISGGFLISGVEEESEEVFHPFILKIDENIEKIWYKRFSSRLLSERKVYLTSFYQDYFHVGFFDENVQETIIYFYDADGNLQEQRNVVPIRDSYFKISGMEINGEMLLVAGNEPFGEEREESLRTGALVTIDFSLNYYEAKYIQYYSNTGSETVKLNGISMFNGNWNLFGTLPDNTNSLVLFPSGGIGEYEKDPSYHTNAIFIDNEIILHHEENEISSIDYNNFSPSWSKFIDLYNLKINSFTSSGEILVHGEEGDFLGLLPMDVDSCRTEDLELINYDQREYNLYDTDYTTNRVETEFIDDYSVDIVDYDLSTSDLCSGGGPGTGSPTTVTYNSFTNLNTPNFYLQAAGSKGEDSTRGIHLRWAFGGKLGENHLAKGNLATTQHNYNKPNDFVKIYRAPYQAVIFTLDFQTPPQLIDHSQRLWVYKFNNNQRIIYVYFKDTLKYDQTSLTIDPMIDPFQFLVVYGEGLIEVVCRTDLFFACSAAVEGVGPTSNFLLEGLSVTENNNVLPYFLSYRKRRSGNDVLNNYFNLENGKKFRFRSSNCYVSKIYFEFYSDFIIQTNQIQGWTKIDDFCLTNDNNEAFTRLEPAPNTVDKKWLRFNDGIVSNGTGSLLRKTNYIHKWTHQDDPNNPLDKDIKDVVIKYIALSNQASNPKALETIIINMASPTVNGAFQFTNNPAGPGDMEISYLDLLNIAGLDFHVARMLGLGHLDLNSSIYSGKFIYIAEYYTNDNLDIKATGKNYQLLSMSLPTAVEDQRLPIPVEIWKVEPGGPANSTGGSSMYDANGYSFDGKKRYVSIFNYEVPDYEFNPSFFGNSEDFDLSSFTNPVYAGLEYRFFENGAADPLVWTKPELSNDAQYTDHDGFNEALPIILPDPNTALYMHRQEKSGTYIYSTYGINWFSRSVIGGEISILTSLKPANTLLPPSGCQSFLIQKENPLMFTSADEQNRYNAISGDKTLVRLLFDYHIFQDEQLYQIPDNVANPLDPNSIYEDSKEVMADDVEIYFRNFPPKTITAQAFDVTPSVTNQLLIVIKTKDYPVPSSAVVDPNSTNPYPGNVIYNEIWKSEYPAGTNESNFIGGIFLLDNISYVIQDITAVTGGLDFTVYKKEVSEQILAGNTNPSINSMNLTIPVIDPAGQGIFNATENMQNTSNWGAANPNPLKVKIGDHGWTIHREIFQQIAPNGTSEKFVQKSRGIWRDATIEMVYQPLYQFTKSNGDVINYHNPYNTNDPNNATYPPAPVVHQGIYKITLNNYSLPNHSQKPTGAFDPYVEWYKGFVRLFTNESEDGTTVPPLQARVPFRVIKTVNVESTTTGDVELYIVDESFEIEEDGSGNPVYVQQGQPFTPKPTAPIIGTNKKINYYPSYRIYLYRNAANNLTETNVLPQGDDLVRYTVFGFKSVDNDNTDMQGNLYKSKFSIPCTMLAQAIIEPQAPQLPTGSTFATRPDKFGKSTYSLLTKFDHKPYSVMFLRSDNNMLLYALYKKDTVNAIKEKLKLLGGQEEPFFNDRWKDFIHFDNLASNGNYTPYPPQVPSTEQYAFPIPDSEGLYDEIDLFLGHYNQTHNTNYVFSPDPNTPITLSTLINTNIPNLRFIDFVKSRFERCFLPLTEIPIIYSKIKTLSSGYRPKNLKQNIRDHNGYLLNPTDAAFEMAPMMTIMNTSPHETLFTDFTLDGSSDNFYFYASREIGTQMSMSEFSPILGPIRLVNSNPAEPPKIMSLLPQLDNHSLGITAKVRVEVNAYPEVQKINKVSLYRALSKLDADSILSMKHIKTVDIADIEIDSVSGCWIMYDEFEDLPEKPYSDPLFYRVVVSRKVEYSETNYFASGGTPETVIEQAPSLPSKITVSTLVESYNPPAPELLYHAEPVNGDIVESVILNWPKVCYKGKYHLYKMSNEGNWKEIARVDTDEKDTSKAHLHLLEVDPVSLEASWEFSETIVIVNDTFYLPLNMLNMDPLPIVDVDGNTIYHHFKVVAENTSNMFSTEEKILTIYKENTWADIAGISSDGTDGMIIQGTFIIR